MTDLRHLLAIYVHAHQTGNSVPPHIDAEARAALAQPEPQEPTDEELDAVWFAARWGRPAQSKPQGPTDEELDAIWFASGSGVDGREWRTFARAVLARWGRPAQSNPVPQQEATND
jgi:hypothetical protein